MHYSRRTTVPYSSEYQSSRLYRRSDHGPTIDSRSWKQHLPYRDSPNRTSGSHDRRAPPPASAMDDEYDFIPTYGSYIYDASSRPRNASLCRCDCCPHSYEGARRVSEGRPRRSSTRERELRCDHYYPHRERHSFSPQGEMPHDHRGTADPRTPAYRMERLRDYRTSEHSPRSKRSGRSGEINVVNMTNGLLFRDKGAEFWLHYGRNDITTDVLNRLVSDPTRFKVVVQWDDGVKERLTSDQEWRDVRKYAMHLRLEEVKHKGKNLKVAKKKAKHVHWAD